MGNPAGLLGFGAGLGAGMPGAPGGSHAAVAAASHPLLKPADLHPREPPDLKGPGSANTEERLVGNQVFICAEAFVAVIDDILIASGFSIVFV